MESHQHSEHQVEPHAPAHTSAGTHEDHAHSTPHAGHDKHEGHDPKAFRQRFRLCLALTISVFLFSEMVQALEDQVRGVSGQAVADFHRDGIRVAMITGDARNVANAVGEQLAIDEVFAEVLPENKADAVEKLQAQGHRVAMVGDGVNDAPALAQADVGVAIGAGTDVAIESAGVVLASDDPRSVRGIATLSRASYRKMVQNLAWATGYNVVAIPLAAGVLAFAGFTLTPAVGAILMSLSTIIVALNAQLLRKLDLAP
jgi:P-type Cu2+ transporter